MLWTCKSEQNRPACGHARCSITIQQKQLGMNPNVTLELNWWLIGSQMCSRKWESSIDHALHELVHWFFDIP